MTIKVTPEQQLHFLEGNAHLILAELCAGYDYNPGSSDLDDEQPIHVSMTLGGYRRAKRLLRELEKD